MGQAVYISFNSLEEIFLNFSECREYTSLEKIIHEHSDVLVDMCDDDFEKIKNENIILKSLIKRPSKKCFALKEHFENLSYSEMYDQSHDIYILDKEDSDCEDLSNKSGVIVTNLSLIKNSNLPIFKRKNQFLKKNTTYSEKIDNIDRKDWGLVFYKADIGPMNAIIINDNHLFNNWKDYIQNTIDIINSAISNSLNCAFQVLIVIENSEGKYKKELLEKILTRIDESVGNDFPNKVQTSILTHPKKDVFHERLIISNYQSLTSHYGFNVFVTTQQQS